MIQRCTSVLYSIVVVVGSSTCRPANRGKSVRRVSHVFFPCSLPLTLVTRTMIGPSLPTTNDRDGDSSDDDFIGPSAPPADGHATEDGMSSAQRAFLEREERQRQAEIVSDNNK